MTAQHAFDIQTIINDAKARAAKLKAQAEGAADVGTPVTTETGAPELDTLLTQFLATNLPDLIKEGEEAAIAIRTVFAGGFQWTRLPTALKEAVEAGEKLAATVSFVVTAAPVKRLDALGLAQALVKFLLRRFVRPFVPALIYPALESAVVGGVGVLYETQVKPRLQRGETPVTDALTYTDAPPAGVPAVVSGSLADQINQK